MKYFKTLSSIIFLFLIISTSGCKKENKVKQQTKFNDVHALIVNTGPAAADGCGWLVKVDSTFYHTDNLPSEFEKDSLSVNINYELSNSKSPCGIGFIPVIHMNSISNR